VNVFKHIMGKAVRIICVGRAALLIGNGFGARHLIG
jgi:hypothetical protein